MNSTTEETCYSVSVVIPAYNIEAYLSRAIESVLAQTLLPDEIIVVDDGSTDQTATIAKQYGSRIRYIHQKNSGLSAARNTGIRNAKCTWIALLDGDDEWLPDKLRLQIELLKRNPHLVWACTNYYVHWVHLDKRTKVHEPDSLKTLRAGREYFDNYFLAANQGAFGHPNTMIFRRQVLFEVGLFREGLAFHEDHDMWWRIAYRWPQFGYLAHPLAIYYHNRPGSLTHWISRKRQIDILCSLIDRHLKLADSYGRLNELKLRLNHYLQWILQSLAQERQNKQILQLLHQFGFVLDPRTRMAYRLKATFPHAAASVLDGYAWIKRHIPR